MRATRQLSKLYAHNRLRPALAGLCLLATLIPVCAQTLPVSSGNSTYVLNYDADRGRLECISNNTNCVWRTTVSESIGRFRDFAAVGTPAGPVIVYSEGNQTRFVLLHFRTGATTIENSGEPLRGVIGTGWLLNCVMQAEQYGAKVVCQTVSGNGIREYKWDINMWGTHKLLGEDANAGTYTAGAAERSQAYADADLKFSSDIPQGFRATGLDEKSMAMYGPTNDVFISVYSDAGTVPIDELGEGYMAELGVTITHRSQETLDDGKPALLLMGNGTINEVASMHAALFFSANDRTYVISYTGRSDAGAAYVPALGEVMASFRAL